MKCSGPAEPPRKPAQKARGPLSGASKDVWTEGDYLAAGVAVAGAVSVDVVVVVVVVDSVPVVVAVEVAAVEVSSTTAGACAAGALSGAAASFFWQPVASANVVAAAKPRIRNFFISLYSFFLKKRVLLESAAETPLRKIDAE
jgi:hypothetical protein